MICEMTAAELEADCRTFTALKAKDMGDARLVLSSQYARVEEDEAGYLRVYDQVAPEEIAAYLYKNGITLSELTSAKIGLEEYYIDLMKGGKAR